MTEPKVEFDLNSMQTENIELMKILDDIRRWYEYREDRNTPAMQTFEGVLTASNPGSAEVQLNIPGQVYGYSGMSEISGGYWVPMTYSASAQFDVCYFALETDNTNNSFVKVKLTPSGANTSRAYKVTLFYRGATDGN